MHEELWTQAGLTSVLVYLLDHDGSNQKTIIANTSANTITVNKIQLLLIMNHLITVKRGNKNNQSLYFLTEKGRRIATLFSEMDSLL